MLLSPSYWLHLVEQAVEHCQHSHQDPCPGYRCRHLHQQQEYRHLPQHQESRQVQAMSCWGIVTLLFMSRVCWAGVLSLIWPILVTQDFAHPVILLQIVFPRVDTFLGKLGGVLSWVQAMSCCSFMMHLIIMFQSVFFH